MRVHFVGCIFSSAFYGRNSMDHHPYKLKPLVIANAIGLKYLGFPWNKHKLAKSFSRLGQKVWLW
jgi:hypothetical protein